MTIKELIQKLAGTDFGGYLQLCKVIAVDTEAQTCTCEPVNGDSNLFDVRLQADMSSQQGFVIFPKVGSFVFVGFFNAHSALVVITGEIDKMKINIGDNEITLASNGHAMINIKGNVDITANNIFLGGNTGVVLAPGLPPGSKIVDISQLQVSTKVKGA